MRKDLQDKLYNDFPNLYGQRKLGMKETCMCWGIECGDGWFQIIYDLSRKITELNPSVQAVQVKEKFGGLRFYTVQDGDTPDVYNLIDEAEVLSYKTCEQCGNTVDVSQTEGWIVTLCKICMDERNKNRA